LLHQSCSLIMSFNLYSEVTHKAKPEITLVPL
jgi:hypothetical protein